MRLYITLFITALIFSGCFSQRAAQGLDQGEINVSSALTMNAIRYGVTDNLELRTSHIMIYTNEPKYNTDLFVHSHGDSNIIDYGVVIGSVVSPVYRPGIYSGIVLSKTFTNYFTPYATYIQPLINPTNDYDDYVIEEYFAIGAEFTISLNSANSIKLHIIPEAEYTNYDGIATIGDPEIATLTVGLSLDLHKLFAP